MPILKAEHVQSLTLQLFRLKCELRAKFENMKSEGYVILISPYPTLSLRRWLIFGTLVLNSNLI